MDERARKPFLSWLRRLRAIGEMSRIREGCKKRLRVLVSCKKRYCRNRTVMVQIDLRGGRQHETKEEVRDGALLVQA